jgi:hypothetical protein
VRDLGQKSTDFKIENGEVSSLRIETRVLIVV